MLIHLALKSGLEDLFREPGQQPVRADEINPRQPAPAPPGAQPETLHSAPFVVITRWLRHPHILLGHGRSLAGERAAHRDRPTSEAAGSDTVPPAP